MSMATPSSSSLPPRFYLSAIDEDHPWYQAGNDAAGLEELLTACPSSLTGPHYGTSSTTTRQGLGSSSPRAPPSPTSPHHGTPWLAARNR
uniref:Uncharacterized protein n=1 Tax=Oryza barthii TaxID=65489 RepID=A0A0D3HEG7_9ORYZ